MTMDDWIQIAKDIEDAYELFDGFVILHGTDTLAYTASALSFMLENLGKYVFTNFLSIFDSFGHVVRDFESEAKTRCNF